MCGRGAAERLRSAGSLDFEIAAGDVADLPRQGFDAVVCRAVLHHVEPLVPVLGSVHGALRPGGALVCSDEPTIRDEAELPSLRRLHPFVQFGVDENALTEEQYRQALRSAGFVSIEVRFPVSWADYRRFVRPDTPCRSPKVSTGAFACALRRCAPHLARCARLSPVAPMFDCGSPP